MAKRTAAEWIDEYDWNEYEDCIGCTVSWFSDIKNKMNYNANPTLTPTRFAMPKINKETMSRWIFDAWQIMDQQRDTLETLKDMIELMKTEALPQVSS